MKETRFQELFRRWCRHQLTPSETAELLQLYSVVDIDKALTPVLRQLWAETMPDALAEEGESHRLVDNILLRSPAEDLQEPAAPEAPPLLRRHWIRYAAAAILLIIAGASFLLLRKTTPPAVVARHIPARDIAPGKDGAILTLADGSQVVLDSLGNGLVSSQNGVQVILENGRLTYKPTDKGSAVAYNTLQIPKGRQLNLSLPDGTRLWLNASSSIRYPTVFTGKERVVEITGEAYFEVAYNTTQPFRVKVRNQAEVEVLGTNFNVSAYEGENEINTTLLQGSLKVRSAAAATATPGREPPSVVLRPGQQAKITPAPGGQSAGAPTPPGRITVLDHVNIDRIMAWKNGLFNFEDAGLKEVMNQLERWYDIEVVYEKGVPPVQFGGEMSRNVPLSEVLDALKSWNIHFRMEEGRKLVVMP